MLDIKFIRENEQKVKQNNHNKAVEVDVDRLLELDDKRRELTSKIDGLRQKRNQNTDKIKQSSGKPDQKLIDLGKQLKTEIAKLEEDFKQIEAEYIELIKQVPNVALDSVPVGLSEDENKVEYQVGDKPQFDFTPLNHYELALKRDWIDKDRAAKIAGARFAYLKGDLVKLQMALVNFVMDVLTDEAVLAQLIKENKLNLSAKPFTPILPPLMLKTAPYDAMDRLEPSDDRYKIEGEDLWLQGSAEHVLGSMHIDEIFEERDLPIRYLGYATSFRKEAGTYGKDMEGIVRMHQFDKLEMESFVTAESGLDEHKLFIAIQEYLVKSLELPYQKLRKCTFDIGKPNATGIDIEVWFPGQNKYRETHTADYMTDYQARRLQTRVRRENGQVELIHTNDATAFALGRIMIGILENNQTKDNKVKVPKVLQKYLAGREIL